MIDEDRTYENEVRYNNDRLVCRNNRKDSESNISLELESTNQKKVQKKEKVNEFYINNDNM
nr:hypothetical protein [uncultured Mediterranean phage uvMED]